ncbi:UDP-N-acetylmuramoylalanine--D-glutamate ligase [Oceanospirillum multiglobuliferum]|uniref:UDP-N-acetylmuramoyl-L-alanine--D-glutamate ligase n=1 Tax=Oceanospirillum multiglobuliferum TaxID=64969 RepID=UPI0009D261D6|nr:UDP-N-acetylmuramoyl-L-alanine--D-glutamate ligase [Oceanospirillum multiglobuliferum]SJZ44886.1 UDP-N-acetylmuramoylalanine--D-glutamate ligase [Oceanospirillum multiglobuliferum]
MPHTVIIGLGQTGLSCARYLAAQGVDFAVADTRFKPAGLDEFEQAFPDAEIWLGPLDEAQLCEAQELVVSPGVAISQPAIARAIASGVSVVGDIELFSRAVSVPIVAITGSNAKSTVTTLVGKMAETAGWPVAVGGNIGIPVLDLLLDLKDKPEAEQPRLFVLELSSFQLETTHSLKAKAASILNLSADHLDRYPSMLEYGLAKQRIYIGCEYAIVNRQDEATLPVHSFKNTQISFGLDQPDLGHFGLRESEGALFLAYGKELLIPTTEITLTGRHGQANALAALALGHSVGLPMSAMLETLRHFVGLPHRCQLVKEFNQVCFIDDSKGTNVGATVAALNGLGAGIQGRIVLIAGGDGKGAEFDGLTLPLQQYARALVLIGRDVPQIAAVAPKSLALNFAQDMTDAVQQAAELALPGDIVLLSPACASFDMFANYVARGQAFASAVQSLAAGSAVQGVE